MRSSPAPSYLAPLSDYEREAAALFTALQAEETDALWKFKWEHPRFRGQQVTAVRAALQTLTLADAQVVVAHQHAFAEWTDLVAFVDAVHGDTAVDRFERAVEAIVAGDRAALQSLLDDHPALIRARSARRHHATLLHYVAANGVEGYRQKTPANAVEIAKVLLEAGTEPDALADMYDATCTTMSMLVSSCHPANAGLQIALAGTLLDHGAALEGPGSNWQSALMTALTFGYIDTARALAERGARVDHIAAAAGLGRAADVARLRPAADVKSRHVALALAAQHGHADCLRVLLEAGEDPNRLNPDGFHAHSTPLHQAIAAGHADVVRLLVERGARLDIRDTNFNGTPLGWAVYCEKPAIAEYLRALGAPE